MKNNEIQNLIEEIISKTGVKINSVLVDEVVNKDNTNCTWFKLEVDDPYFFTNKNAEALLSLNHIIKRIIENKNPLPLKEGEKRDEIIIDINNFQKRKIENVRAIAHMMAERARYFKSNIEVDPMSAFERRIIHEFLGDAMDLKTESFGFGQNRRVVIKYIGNI